jgi:hypothetical protein
MSFSPLDVYGDMLSEEMTTKTNLINEETRQCIVSSKPERICDTLVNNLLYHLRYLYHLSQYQDFGI